MNLDIVPTCEDEHAGEPTAEMNVEVLIFLPEAMVGAKPEPIERMLETYLIQRNFGNIDHICRSEWIYQSC